jgi:hypothetical protein
MASMAKNRTMVNLSRKSEKLASLTSIKRKKGISDIKQKKLR